MVRISPFFPKSHEVTRVDGRRVVSGIVYVIRNGLQWKDALRHGNIVPKVRVFLDFLVEEFS